MGRGYGTTKPMATDNHFGLWVLAQVCLAGVDTFIRIWV